MADMKVCSKCRRELPATTEYFYCAKNTKDGLRYTCKECQARMIDRKRRPYHNKYIDRGDGTSYIVFYDKARNEKSKMGLVDNDDIPMLSKHTWVCANTGYAINNDKCLMHRIIMKAENGMFVDHINHDKLDNRKCNLRICTPSQNNMNGKVRCDNTSGVRGIGYEKRRNRWIVQISAKGKRRISRYYKTFEEAVKARKRLEEEYFGEFAYGGVANG